MQVKKKHLKNIQNMSQYHKATLILCQKVLTFVGAAKVGAFFETQCSFVDYLFPSAIAFETIVVT